MPSRPSSHSPVCIVLCLHVSFLFTYVEDLHFKHENLPPNAAICIHFDAWTFDQKKTTGCVFQSAHTQLGYHWISIYFNFTWDKYRHRERENWILICNKNSQLNFTLDIIYSREAAASKEYSNKTKLFVDFKLISTTISYFVFIVLVEQTSWMIYQHAENDLYPENVFSYRNERIREENNAIRFKFPRNVCKLFEFVWMCKTFKVIPWNCTTFKQENGSKN